MGGREGGREDVHGRQGARVNSKPEMEDWEGQQTGDRGCLIRSRIFVPCTHSQKHRHPPSVNRLALSVQADRPPSGVVVVVVPPQLHVLGVQQV